MDDKKEILTILEKIINDFSIDNLVRLFQNKTTKFRMLQSPASQPLFTDGLLLGEFGCGDESVCIFTFKTHQPLTERSGKKAQYELAKKMLKEQIRYDGGFFIFYDEQGNFRFSLIYDIPLSSGTREWSNFKRYTYYVSKEQTNKTFIQQMAEADFSSLNSIIKAFSVEKVTREFYNDIANWYFWALQKVQFPKDAEQQSNGRNIALIRFITRIIFVWFMKEKKLISPQLFDFDHIKNILKSTDDNESTYYKAILQNLFFATLNTPIPERKFRTENRFQGKNEDYMNHEYFRYQELFSDPKQDINLLFNEIPFLNGGLFECLDKPKNDPSNDTGDEIRMDGFSDKKENQPIFPNELFFSKEKNVDLTEYYGDTKYKNTRVQGLISILNAYNFTVDENTPLDEEVALDPELLGKVFENLLASYNPETATTARKATGSYYTPREIVDYMVTESLKYYFKTKFENTFPPEELDEKLTSLFSYSHEEQPFNEKETDFIIEKINELKIIDPAVGSGAFPIGVLNKLVFLLSKLDPHNEKWKAQQFRALDYITDPTLKNELREKIENNFKRNELDYGRKLYLIQNCIYGVDIQPIAIHIAKLRFFISLLVDEKINPNIDDNFGIEPLPNLETKLVAANTLIGLPTSKQLVIKSDETKQIEAELFQIRKQHFTANYEKKKKEIQKRDRELRNRLKELLEESGFPSDYTEKIASWDLYDTNRSAEWFDPEWMFGVKNGFDMVIGNPPYVSTKGVPENEKKRLMQQYGFADDLYSHFFFRGFDLLKSDGVLSFITSKTYWTIQTKRNVRELLQKNNILEIFDTASPFAAMVDTAVILVQKREETNNYTFLFKDGKQNLNDPLVYTAKIDWYKNAPNNVFFIPNETNIKIANKYFNQVQPLLDKWWDKISTSKNIEKYKNELEEYRSSLKPGDITLMGLITEGGVGLQTGDNSKYIGVKEGTKLANNVRKQRPEKLLLAAEFCKQNNIKTKQEAEDCINKLNELEIRKLFDEIKEKYGRDIFGQGWLFRIVSDDEIADVDLLTDDDKLNGIIGNKTFVPYDKGDKDGNRWYAPTPYYIDWNRENVKALQTDPKARWQGYQFFFREGFCWNFALLPKNEESKIIKCRIKEKTVNDVMTMALCSIFKFSPNYYIVALLNSKFSYNYLKTFINSTAGQQINDIRQLPIIIPTDEQLCKYKDIFDSAVKIQKDKFAGKISVDEAEEKLTEIQKELDKFVEGMYL